MYKIFIDVDELKKAMELEEQPVLIDCRFALAEPEKGREDYRKDHLPGAYYAHIDEDLAAPHVPGVTGRHPLPDMDTFRSLMRSFGVDKKSLVVVYDDRGGGTSARLWWLLRYCGHPDVVILNGGYPAWTDAGYSITNVIPPEKMGSFEIDLQPELVVDGQWMKEAYADPKYVIVDSRASERYLGINEPIDPVAGHIPFAVNLPYEDNFDELMRIRSSAEILKRFEPVFRKTESRDVVVYCGSGVTAAANLAAMAHVGYDDVKLYAGSWSDWITDPGNPVATGEEK